MKLRNILGIAIVFLGLAAIMLIGMRGDTSSANVLSKAESAAFRDIPPGTEALLPLPPVPELPAAKVALGKRLFFDPRLSHNDKIACASCHQLDRGGNDRLPVSVGIDGKKGSINAPTVFNSSLNFVQFWDGRAATLEEQAAGPVHNPLEMGSNWPEVIAKLSQDEQYRREFADIYRQGISGATIVDAIATFERTLLTPNSRFDRYLRGEKEVLDALEQSGLQRFLGYGCASCHQGVGIGGNLFQRFGVMDNYFKRDAGNQANLGRFNVTRREADRHVFKVPSLRNVALTAPYFHDASAKTLEEAVIIMGRFQLGRELSDADVEAITAFLRTLTGEWEGKGLQ
jgi:cytochrome c peroxidase